MSNGIVGLPSYQSGGLLDRIREWANRRQRKSQTAGDRWERLVKGQSEEEQAADHRRKAAERFEERLGPAIDSPRLRSMQPLLDSLQAMLPAPPEGDGYAGYSESGEIPFSVRPGTPEEYGGVYYSPWSDDGGLLDRIKKTFSDPRRYMRERGREQENIVISPESMAADPAFTRSLAMHEVGHAVDWRDPKGERGWLSPELREAIYGSEAPFDTEGFEGDALYVEGRYSADEPHQRMANYVGDAINFLQTSKDPTIDPEYTRQYLSERPHLQRVTEELLQLPIYQEHPFLTGSLGEAYEPEPEPENAFAWGSHPDWPGPSMIPVQTGPRYRSSFKVGD